MHSQTVGASLKKMSTMTNINVKFPITFKSNRLSTDLIPKEYYANISDNRRSGRILCKTEMIHWYIDNIDENDEKEVSITKLFESSSKKFEKVFNYPWENVTFKIGTVSLSRSLVPVNPNDIDMPKEFIKPAILQTLNLDNMIEYTEVPDYYLNQVKSILDKSNLDIRSLPNILNYIVSQMDKRYRYLPILRGLSPDFIYISHALLQSQYRASTLLSESSMEKGQNKSITELCINLLYHCKMNGIPFYKIRDFINTFTFYGYHVLKILHSTDENKFTRFVKGCVGIKIMPDLKNLAFTLGQIAVFMTKGFDTSKARTMKSMRQLIAKHYSEKWWLVVGLEENAIRAVKKEIETGDGDVAMGALRFSDSVEIEYPDSERCIIKDDVLIGEKTGQPICVAPFVAEMVDLDFNIKTGEPKLYSLLNR